MLKLEFFKDALMKVKKYFLSLRKMSLREAVLSLALRLVFYLVLVPLYAPIYYSVELFKDWKFKAQVKNLGKAREREIKKFLSQYQDKDQQSRWRNAFWGLFGGASNKKKRSGHDEEKQSFPRKRVHQTSAFLNKLPAEIRSRIFEYVVAPTGRIHIHHTMKKAEVEDKKGGRKPEGTGIPVLKSLVCKHPGHKVLQYHGCWDTSWPQTEFKMGLKDGVLDLLLVCWTVYREAVDVLYMYNTFDFSSLSTFLFFAAIPMVPLPHIHKIRSLTLTFLPDPSPDALKTLRIVGITSPLDASYQLAASLPNLRHVRLAIAVSPYDHSAVSRIEEVVSLFSSLMHRQEKTSVGLSVCVNTQPGVGFPSSWGQNAAADAVRRIKREGMSRDECWLGNWVVGESVTLPWTEEDVARRMAEGRRWECNK